MTHTYTLDRALAEAGRCLLCHEPPCNKGCPSSTDPGRFVRQLRFQNLKGAITTIKRNNPLGGLCGALCPTCGLCQQACTASGLDLPIDIGGLQRFLVEYAWEIGFSPLRAGEPNGIRVAVVGAGPSGLACAAELAQDGYEVTLFDRHDAPGGVPRHVLPEHRLATAFLQREIQEILDLGVTFVGGRAVEDDDALAALLDEGYEAVYVATGAWEPVRLDVPGGDCEGVHDALAFLASVKADPTPWVRQLQDREVAVIGGGDTAMDAAVTARRLGARDVYVVYRRSFQEMPGDDDEKIDALRAGVHFLILTQPVAYHVEDGELSAIRAVRNRLGEGDVNGRRQPIPLPGSEHVLPVDLAIEAIGLRPGAALGEITSLQRDGAGRVVVRPGSTQTSLDRVFAGGDAVRGAALIADAVGDGKRAADAIRDSLGRRV